MKNVSKFTKIALAVSLLLPVSGQMQAWSWSGVAKTAWNYKEAVVGAGIGAGLKACIDRRIEFGGENGNIKKILLCGLVGGAVGFAWTYFQKSEHEKTRDELKAVENRLGEKVDKVQEIADETKKKLIELSKKLVEIENSLKKAIKDGNTDLAKQLEVIRKLLLTFIQRENSK